MWTAMKTIVPAQLVIAVVLLNIPILIRDILQPDVTTCQ